MSFNENFFYIFRNNQQKKKASNQDELAVASFASFTKYKQSYIQGLFLSQYHSTIPCLGCGKHSSTFDPYTNLSLEIPSKPKIVLYSTVVYASDESSNNNIAIPKRFGFEFQRKGTIHELRAGIVEQSGIQNFNLVEIKNCGTTRCFSNDDPLSILPDNRHSLYAVELGQQLYDVGKSEVENQINEIVLVISNVERRCGQNKR